MSFQAAISSVFQKYVCFTGRARRSEYWYFILFNWAVNLVLTALYRSTESAFVSTLMSLWSIGVFLPNLGVSWRRLHDVGRSGAWWFLNFVPLVGQIILLIWLCKDSQPGPNQYGDSPKYPSGGFGGYNPNGYTPNNGYNPNNSYNPNNGYNPNAYTPNNGGYTPNNGSYTQPGDGKTPVSYDPSAPSGQNNGNDRPWDF